MLVFLSGCADSLKLANYDQVDLPVTIEPNQMVPEILSAFWGFNSESPLLSSLFVCRGASGKDAMPVTFPVELDLSTLQMADFSVIREDGTEGSLICVTPAPAFDQGELRTMLLIGDFGSIENPAESVTVVGNLLSADNQFNFKGKKAPVIPLLDGPSLVIAEPVSKEHWELDKSATMLPFGGGSGCPVGTKQIVRAVWNGGITKPGGAEVDELEQNSYQVTLQGNDGKSEVVTPFALGDLGDGDNIHKLCLDQDGTPIKVSFPQGLLTDPREDLNPATSIKVTR